MAYKALYRTYRPQNFSEVVGQEIVVKTLQNSIINNKISHAYLFCGPRGTGKTTIARIFAKALNCNNRTGAEPCNDCAICQEITNGVNPDVIEIDAASNNGVDEMRDLKEKVKFLPAGTKYKIYIIDEVHMLSTSAFNALLKTLEEPPAHAIFILATTEPHKVLPTIVSRCQRYDFKSLTQTEIIENISNICDKENIKYTIDALQIIAKASEGGMRDALSFLDQAISLSEDIIDEQIASVVTGLLDKKTLLDLATFLENKKITEALEIIEKLQDSGKEVEKIISGLLGFYRDILMCKAGISNEDEETVNFSDKIDIRKVYYIIDVLSDVSNKVKFNTSASIFLEVAIIKIINASSAELDYGKRISELEEQIKNLANYANTNQGTEFDNVDNKRIRLLEEKFNNLLTELSKLELVRLIERVKTLETNANNSADLPNYKEVNNKVDKIVEDIELLKVVQEGIRTELDNVSLGGIDDSLLEDKIESNIKKIKPSVNYTEIENYVKKQIENIELPKDNNTDLEERISEVEKNVQIALNKEASTKEVITKEMVVPTDLINRIENLENNQVKNINYNEEEKSLSNQEYEERITSLENKFSSMQIENEHIKQNINNDNDKLLDELINSLEERIVQLENSINNNANNLDNSNEEENRKFYEFKLKELEDKIDEILKLKSSNSNIPNSDYEERLNKMESNIYKIMSGMLKPTTTKKTKSKVDEKQISIWRDDIIDVSKINTPNENIKTDFGDFAINEELEQKPIIIDIKEEKVVDVDETSASIDNSYPKEEEEQASNIFEESLQDFYDDNQYENHINDNHFEEVELNQDNFFANLDSSVDNDNHELNDDLSKEAKELEELEEKKRLEQIEKERLEALEKKRLEQIEKQKREIEEKRRIEEESRQQRIAEQKRFEELKRQEELDNKELDNDLDEYERYDVKVLERIMNDARNPEYATERERILNLWKHLVNLAPADKRGVAEILVEGQVKAVGNHEFVIIYDSSAICNQVMSRRFKRSSLKLLYDLLDGDYNYFAITNEVWFMKRTEYSEQYSIGTKYPTLTPINDPRLKVNNEEEKSEADEMLKRMHDIFGSTMNIKKRG